VADEKSESKSTPLPWVVLSGILGIFAIGTPASNPPALPKAAEKKDAPEKGESAPFHLSGKNPLKPVYDFYATHDGEWRPEEDLRRRLHNYDVEFLIATVPDPLDSPYGHAFDQVVDAVQRAVEKKDGYILDRSWLPWDLDRKAKPKADEKPGEGPATLRESHPGVLLFRHGKMADKGITRPGLCVVFLVGETPQGGLHKRAFTRALRMMDDAGHPESAPVRVVGPYFSGSQTSLQFVAGDWWAGGRKDEGKGPKGEPNPLPSLLQASFWLSAPVRPNPVYAFDVITGNAAVFRKKDFFQLDAAADGHPHWHSDKFSLTATVVPTRSVVTAVLRYLARRDGCRADEPVGSNVVASLPGKVAILAESNTGFGKVFTGINRPEELLLLRFPLHISRAKNEYTQAFRQKDEKAGLRPADSLIPSTFDEGNRSAEGVPSQGGATTAAVNAQVLANILATVAREQCRYVGVVASDTRDKLFLVRLIREYCPDVHVFVTDADQLLLHPDYRYYMRGVVVGSTYPLMPQNQRWVSPDAGERILFPTSGAQGYYNAALMHLGKHDQLLEYAPPRFAAAELGPAGEKALRRPPIWISTVSPNGTLVPLQVFTDYDDPAGDVRLNPAPAAGGVPAPLGYPGALLPVGLALLAFWAFLAYQALFGRSARMFWDPAAGSAEFSLPQLCYRNILLGSQALLAVPVLMIVAAHAEASQWRAAWMTALVGVVGLLLGCFLMGMVKPLCWPPARLRQFAHWLRPGRFAGGRGESWSWAGANVLLVAMVVGFAALLLARFWVYGGPTRRALFFVRAVDLSTGLSPATPLFFMALGFAAWAYFQLKRAERAERYAVPPPFPAGAGDAPHDGAFARVTELDRAAQEEVFHESLALRHLKAIVLAVLGLAALGLAVWAQSLPTFEGWAWDGLFFAGFWLLFLLGVTTLVRLVYLWRGTKRLLDAVALVPMMRAFARLPAKVSDVFGRYLFTARPRLEHLQLPLHQLRLLADAAAKDPEAPRELAGLGRVADALDGRLHEGLDPAAGAAAARKAERDLRGKLSAVAAGCLTALAPRWQTLPVEDAYGEGGRKDEKAKEPAAPEPAWVPLAENVVAAQIIVYVSQFFAQLRGLVVTAMVCTSLLLLAATSYPFHPERLLLVCLLGLSAAGLGLVIYVLLEMNRDEVVSRILKTTPGRLSLDSGFVGSFLTYVVPTVGILAAQLSGSFRWLLEPILHVMK
jgi:hypothetical protein